MYYKIYRLGRLSALNWQIAVEFQNFCPQLYVLDALLSKLSGKFSKEFDGWTDRRKDGQTEGRRDGET